MQPNYDESVRFLQVLRPKGFWILSAVNPDPGCAPEERIETRPFAVTETDAVKQWLERHGATRNIYFSVNPTLRPMHKKAELADMASMEFVHVDVDPRKGKPFDEERARSIRVLTTELPEGVPPPTLVVDSGGGAWGFWRLEEPMAIDGSAALYEEAARFNVQLEVLFDADNCHNVDRIARVPGTINWPTSTKKAKGRVPSMSTVLVWDGPAYPLSRFTPAPLTQDNDLGGFSAPLVKISGNVRRIASLDELGEKVSNRCKMVINLGHDPDDPNKWSSRSEPLFWVCCELIRSGVDDETIFSIITDPEFKISESVLEKGRKAEKYALKQITSAKEEAIDPDLFKLNQKHAVIGDINGKCRIVSETTDELMARTLLTFQTFEDFHHRYGNRHKETAGLDGKPASIPMGKWWTMHPNRRQFERIVFAPGRDIESSYNLWKGFSCEARPGSCHLWLEHVRENICSGRDDIFKYLLGWMATAVQFPDRPGQVAVVMRGKKGTGKGKFATLFGSLFGRHFVPVTNSEHLVGRFNDHLRDCIVLFADEAFYAGDKKHESMLKTMVTEDMLIRESKGVDASPARNYIHLIMASNNDWVIPANADERRYLMLQVGAGSIQNSAYFSAIDKEFETGGREALLHYLMHYNLAGFEVRRVPMTEALQEQKKHSFSIEEEWWFEKLSRGYVFEGAAWPEQLFCTHVAHDFTSYTKSWGTGARSSATRLGMFLQKAIPGGMMRSQLTGTHEVVDISGMPRQIERPRVYRIPDLEACRKHFVEQFIGGEFQWDKLEVVASTTINRDEPF